MREQPSLRPAGFGTRYLEDKERVFEHNAWDNVEWDPEMEKIAQKTIETQKQTPVPSDKVAVLLSEPAKQWDEFYSQHKEKFFMNRNWLLKEFPELDMSSYPEDAKVRLLEVGCGVGNTSIPLAQWDTGKKMHLYSCDYSAVAVELLKSNPEFDSTRCHGFVWDITQPPPEDVEKESLDFVLCIYVLSALHPTKTKQAIAHLRSLLKPGGILLLKDYGRFDLTQLRFKQNRLIEENLYCRGDGTLVYFRTKEDLDELFEAEGFSVEAHHVDRRLIVNRAKQVKMYRVWLQAKYKKRESSNE